MNNSDIGVTFYLDKRMYAARLWQHVPRVGDEVMLGVGGDYDFETDASGKTPFKVVRVVWGVEAEASTLQAVNVEIVHVTSTEGQG